jgi:hypothetical protein
MNFKVHVLPKSTIQYAYPNLQPRRLDKEKNYKPTYENFLENSTQANIFN